MSASSMKVIKNRIKSVQGTMQITKAMELVATSKMRKASQTLENASAYFNILGEAFEDIAEDNRDFSSVFTKVREGRTCRIVIAGDRGLAGGYNHNILRSLNFSEDDIILPIGVKSREFFSGYNMFSDEKFAAGTVEMDDCLKISETVTNGYKNGDFASVTLSYTRFVNMLVQRAETVNILPLAGRKERKNAGNVILFEPEAEESFDIIIPYYIGGMLFGAVSHSVASELAARRNAMQSANDNAEEIIDKLSLEYNRARQASITQDLTEITAGAENLE